MENLLHKKNSKKGQTVIEFAFVSMIFIFMLVLTFNAVLAFSTQQYLSYVTFMAARAYQAAGGTPADQRSRAISTFGLYIPPLRNETFPATQGMLDLSGKDIIVNFPHFSKELARITKVYVPITQANVDYGPGGARESDGGTTDRFIGLEFQVFFAQFPLGEAIRNRFGKITLYTRSFLGREVSKSECSTFFSSLAARFGADAAAMEDQGC